MEMKNHVDIEEEFKRLWDRIQPYTMTSLERGYALYKGVQYVSRSRIEGAMVECGVWKGGSCMIIAETLSGLEDTERELYLYDTYEGMPRPSEHDKIAYSGQPVLKRWENNDFGSWAVSVDEVRDNVAKTDYPEQKFRLIKGDVKETFKTTLPASISLLRLDTDWYESTLEELVVLYPLLVPGGVLIIDDYGHFAGAKKAVDDYFRTVDVPILLNRIDYTGRIGVKRG